MTANWWVEHSGIVDHAFRAVLFDYGGILTATYREAAFLSELASKFAVRPDELRMVLREGRLLLDLSLGRCAEEDMVAQVCAALPGARPIHAEEVMASSFEPNTRVLELIELLRRRSTAKICVASNIFPRGALYLRELGVADRFDHLFFSCEFGVRKPDPAFLDRACEAMSAKPSDCLLFDDLDSDVAAARELGMTSIRVCSREDLVAGLEGLLR